MGEAINLVNNFKVERVIFNCGEFNDLEQELIKVLDNLGESKIYRTDEDGSIMFKIKNNKLKRDNVDNEYTANSVHYEVGREIRNSIKRLGGTMPEDLPTPEKSLKELEKESKKLKE